jgi:2-(1,2-epoxy-1,2-dihydrophenyl)acetyl-CoA isomerase
MAGSCSTRRSGPGVRAVAFVEQDLSDGILALRLARPERLNAISPEFAGELDRALARAEDDDVAVLTLTGAGRSFCAGADVEEAVGLTDLESANAFLESFARLLRRISNLPKPVVVGMHGPVVGGGAELALEADLRVAASDTEVWFPDVALGSTPASLWRLVRMVGISVATEMAMLERRLDADEMHRLGIVHEVVEPELLPGAVTAMAERVRDRAGTLAMGLAKRGIALAAEADRETDLRGNLTAMLASHANPEQHEAVSRFAARRKGR